MRMAHRNVSLMVIIATSWISACTGGLRPEQQTLVTQWESTAQRLGQPEIRYQEIKSPTTAAGLGFLPGAGGFYTGRTGVGVAGILTWPLSIAWEPAVAHSAAYDYNFSKFRDRMIDLGMREAGADERELESELVSKQIPSEVYQARRDRLRQCSDQLNAEHGLAAAIRTPAAINRCLDEVAPPSAVPPSP